MSKKISRRNRRIRNVLLVISMMMVVAMASVGVTVAWLTDSTDEVVNTFTAGNINIELEETPVGDGSAAANSYKMVPGNDIEKDPKVTVKANSEPCWLFVQLTETGGYTKDSVKKTFDDFLTYELAKTENGTAIWSTLREGADGGVYYCEVTSSTADQEFYVLAGNKVSIKGSVTKDMMDEITGESNAAKRPVLTVKAYACQMDDNIASAEDAWTVINTGNLPTT